MEETKEKEAVKGKTSRVFDAVVLFLVFSGFLMLLAINIYHFPPEIEQVLFYTGAILFGGTTACILYPLILFS